MAIMFVIYKYQYQYMTVQDQMELTRCFVDGSRQRAYARGHHPNPKTCQAKQNQTKPLNPQKTMPLSPYTAQTSVPRKT